MGPTTGYSTYSKLSMCGFFPLTLYYFMHIMKSHILFVLFVLFEDPIKSWYFETGPHFYLNLNDQGKNINWAKFDIASVI